MSEATADLSTLAGEAYEFFERRTRSDADETLYTTLQDDAPDWLRKLVREAHGDMPPDDWRYECICDALAAIEDGDEDGDEFADDVDVYTGDLTAWLASHGERPGYCDEALCEGLCEAKSTDQLLRAGQYMERHEVFGLVVDGLTDHLKSLA